MTTPARWAMQNDEDRGDLACLAELWIIANDPDGDGPDDRAVYLDTIRFIAVDVARRVQRMHAEMAPRPPTSYCNGCRAWCRNPHTDCIGVPLWVRSSACQRLGMPVRDIDRGLRSGTLVYDPEAKVIRDRPAAVTDA